MKTTRTIASPKQQLTTRLLQGSVILVGLALAVFANRATAATPVTTTFQVTATVISACTVSGSSLNFGNTLDSLSSSTPVDATSTVSVSCSNTTPYTVSLNAGANAGGASNYASRTMKSGSDTLAYQLYLDSGRSTVWGDGTSSSSAKNGTGSGSTQSLTVYGRLPSLANAVPGSYTDTVTVTISY
ncbi:Spore coat protein U (SCPU) domain-containing protein [Roseateles sp. YR242]|uniref:Csu type fimbrial protein n=1 Tax=Roseateles sp. YR242 TaxID=1855305 RepID=UPI0008AE2D26|nr:spore coat U domain-containing protein [Roseateles sp. YR242]SEL83830.1 Spore coat protein U (SCPU) domain-containing protein [Roseateles sp. YR242]